jgi:hypothetical protein
MQCLGTKKKIPLIELRSVVLPAYANTICTTNEGVKYGDYNRVLSNRKARELFKHNHAIHATRIDIIQEQILQLSATPNLHFPCIKVDPSDANKFIVYLPGTPPSNLLVITYFYVTLGRTSDPNYFTLSYNTLYSIFMQFFTLFLNITETISSIQDGQIAIVYSPVSCCTIANLTPLIIS